MHGDDICSILAQLLQITISSFPSYSKHDESHAATVLTNIEMILGEERIAELSATDCFMILHTVYIHDIGMVITHTDREQIVQNDKFLEMVEKLNHENDFVFQKAIKALRQTKYDYSEKDTKEEAMKQLYSDKLKVYYRNTHSKKHSEIFPLFQIKNADTGSVRNEQILMQVLTV